VFDDKFFATIIYSGHGKITGSGGSSFVKCFMDGLKIFKADFYPLPFLNIYSKSLIINNHLGERTAKLRVMYDPARLLYSHLHITVFHHAALLLLFQN